MKADAKRFLMGTLMMVGSALTVVGCGSESPQSMVQQPIGFIPGANVAWTNGPVCRANEHTAYEQQSNGSSRMICVYSGTYAVVGSTGTNLSYQVQPGDTLQVSVSGNWSQRNGGLRLLCEDDPIFFTQSQGVKMSVLDMVGRVVQEQSIGVGSTSMTVTQVGNLGVSLNFQPSNYSCARFVIEIKRVSPFCMNGYGQPIPCQ